MADDDDEAFAAEMVGFCVTAQIEALDEPRKWWAEKLRISESHMVKMTRRPSPAFIRAFDSISVSGHRRGDVGQRLRPRLFEFYGQVRPDGPEDSSLSVLELFAREPQILDNARLVAITLMRSDAMMLRHTLLEEAGEASDEDPAITYGVEQLMQLASGPYGGSSVAHQRCAELGLLVPTTFFTALEEHLDTPVGFRLLRTLDRFVTMWRRGDHEAGATRLERRYVRSQIADVLSRQAAAATAEPYLDPYPGNEWAITLARACLETGGALPEARSWLRRVLDDETVSDRARLYAALILSSYPEDGSDHLEVLADAPEGGMLRRWHEPLSNLASMREEGATSDVLFEIGRRPFAVEYQTLRAAMKTLGDPIEKVHRSLRSVLFSAIITPDGRLRRHLIEATITAGLAVPASEALTALLDEEKAPPLSTGLRESIVFLLSRLRQPSDHVIDALLAAAEVTIDDTVRQAAVWGMGDVFEVDRDDLDRSIDTAGRFLAVLGPASAAGPARVRQAATHAIAVIARALDQWARRSEGDEKKRSTPKGQLVAARDTYLKALAALMSPTTAEDRAVARMAAWGRQIATADQLVDPRQAAASVPSEEPRGEG